VLKGVLRLRDLILSSRKRLIDDVMIRDPDVVDVNTPLRTIQGMFEVHSYSAMPVVDEAGRMVGAVLEKDVAEAARKSSSRTLLKLTGIFGGEELRSMPLSERLGKRLPWLLSIMALALCAAIVIALFEETVAVIPALVIFLPVVAGVSGSSGNQAVGLTLREMALGAVRPGDLFHVLSKEARLGIINGVVLGLVLAGIGLSWKQEQGAKFGLLLGLALAINSVVSVCLGGILPLVLRRINIDPAMASGPITTMMADACGFFLVLGFATMALL
jgi:magnesium transporter